MINADGSHHKLAKIGGRCLSGSGDTVSCLISHDHMIDESSNSVGEIILPQVTKILVRTKISITNIYWGSFVLLQNKANIVTNEKESVITNWASYYKLG